MVGTAQRYASGHHRPLEGVMLTVNNLTGSVLFARDAVNTRTGTRYFQRGAAARCRSCRWPTPTAARSTSLAPLAVGGHTSPCWGAYPRPRS